MITNNTSQNPWYDLPKEPPYIASTDTKALLLANTKASGLRFDVLPDPYMGDIDKAEVVLLALNPGFQDTDLSVNMQDDLYREQNLLNLTHESDTPFYVLDERLSFSGGYKWWSRILKPITEAGVSKDELAQKIMCIQYVPYHSTTYYHLNTKLPSQEYSFSMVRQAISQNKPIIMMRSERLWLEAVPELVSYPYLKIRNPRNPVISPKNSGEEQFVEVLDKLQ